MKLPTTHTASQASSLDAGVTHSLPFIPHLSPLTSKRVICLNIVMLLPNFSCSLNNSISDGNASDYRWNNCIRYISYVVQLPMSTGKNQSSFSYKLGEGGYGSVYKGQLPNGSLVAARIVHLIRIPEIHNLPRNFRNLVKLIKS
ncbi:hypothetical protein RND81_02G155400 [Saponaria officinalis]|uniref:Protein kinase domain-containing protein n=1 Tax=Saponaria officinalis TaxID=3572 RepID=A0AAW1MLT6_SAPOF